jgi:hypothetical protein
MRHLLFIVLPLLLISFACSQEKQDKMDMKADKQIKEIDHSAMHIADSMKMADEKVIYYTCPMEAHKAVHSDKPGKCSECGMALVPAVVTTKEMAEFYGCPMEAHSHVRSDKPGKCAECGMELKPMRLKKMEKM